MNLEDFLKQLTYGQPDCELNPEFEALMRSSTKPLAKPKLIMYGNPEGKNWVRDRFMSQQPPPVTEGKG